jgi:UDP-glucose 4-epimerase
MELCLLEVDGRVLALAYAREKALPVVIARIFNTVGPRQIGQFGMVLPRFIAAAKAGKPLQVFGDGKQTRCFVTLQTRWRRSSGCRTAPPPTDRVINIGSNEEISMLELARL